MAMKNDVNVGSIVTIAVTAGLFLLVVVVGVQAWFMYMENAEVSRKWAESPNVALEQMKKDQLARISDYRVVDAKTRLYAMPIGQAMKIVEEKHGNITWAAESTK